jgi:hypothetical protein
MTRVLARRWGYAYGPWWMVQYSLDWTFSLGLHIDPVRRDDYGPYIEFHLISLAISVGRNPGRANNHSLMRPGLMEGK